MSKSVKQHKQEADRLEQHVKDANALMTKLAEELSKTRTLLEELRIFAPNDRFRIEAPWHLRQQNRNDFGMADLIAAQVLRINVLLGDRA